MIGYHHEIYRLLNLSQTSNQAPNLLIDAGDGSRQLRAVGTKSVPYGIYRGEVHCD
jgi:hypothetical protein